MIQDNLSAFPHNYRADILTEFPSGEARTFYYPGGSDRGGRDGLAIALTAHNGERWIGIFAFGGFGGSITALASTPDPGTLCVVSEGDGYLVKVDDPDHWSDIPVVPVTYLQPIPESGMIVVADYTSIAALGGDRLLWRTKQISWDGIFISHIGPHYIEGEGWDPTMKTRPAFRVSLATGESVGGSSPDNYTQSPVPRK